MRRFNTSGPNILKQHYTLPRENFIQEGLELVEENRYFTIWASRQTGKSYREANVALGRTDLLINVQNEELLIETKVFTGASLFKKGKKQLAYYCKHLGLDRGIYLVFIPEHILTIHKATVFEVTENIEGVDIYTYLVDYEEEMPEYRKP